VGAGPEQPRQRIAAVVVELHHQVVPAAGGQPDAAVVLDHAVIGPVVHQRHHVHPQPGAVIVLGVEGVRLGPIFFF